jgi:hypothetical protein
MNHGNTNMNKEQIKTCNSIQVNKRMHAWDSLGPMVNVNDWSRLMHWLVLDDKTILKPRHLPVANLCAHGGL